MRESVEDVAILLRSVPYREADRMVTFLSRDHGVQSAIARNAQKSRKRFPGGLGPGCLGNARWKPGRSGGGAGSLEGFDISWVPMGWASNLVAAAHGAYGLELVEKLSPPEQSDPLVFQWLADFCRDLDARGPTALRLRTFEAGLLHMLGLFPELDTCLACGVFQEEGLPVRLLPQRGVIVCGSCWARLSAASPEKLPAPKTVLMLDGDVRQLLRWLRDAEMPVSPLEAQEGQSSEELPKPLNAAARKVLAALLAQQLPGPLKSLDFLRNLANQKGPNP